MSIIGRRGDLGAARRADLPAASPTLKPLKTNPAQASRSAPSVDNKHRIAASLGLRGRGQRYFCPICQAKGGRDPGLALSANWFNCLKCGFHASAVDLVRLVLVVDIPAAVEWLRGTTGAGA